MPTSKNPYPGVNAHLNSYLQTGAGGWEGFHAEHIIDIRRVIGASLPDGYYARAERSMQISEYIADYRTRQMRVKPDVSVYRKREDTDMASDAQAVADPPAYTIPLMAPYDTETQPASVRIYRVDDDSLPGTPVTHIELLSPANMPGSSYHERYTEKRYEVVRSGLNLVEVDYLHHTPPVVAGLPSYPQNDSNAYPYVILVSVPEPMQMSVYGAGVLERLPIVRVPLRGTDAVTVDFGGAYQRTHDSLDIVPLVVDMETVPVAFEEYAVEDQQRLRAWLGLP